MVTLVSICASWYKGIEGLTYWLLKLSVKILTAFVLKTRAEFLWLILFLCVLQACVDALCVGKDSSEF